MPSLYVGGYFSQIVISALYPLQVLEVGSNLTAATNPSSRLATTVVSPLDTATTMEEATVAAVNLVVESAFYEYLNLESSTANLSMASVPGVDLVTTLSPSSYTNTESAGKLNTATVNAVTLVVTIAFVTYSNLETSQKLTSAAVNAVNLI